MKQGFRFKEQERKYELDIIERKFNNFSEVNIYMYIVTTKQYVRSRFLCVFISIKKDIVIPFLFSSVPPVALAVPKPLFRAAKLDPVRPVYMEEIWEERPVIEYERVMYEQILEPDNIFREPVYQYYVDTEDRFEERFETGKFSANDTF